MTPTPVPRLWRLLIALLFASLAALAVAIPASIVFARSGPAWPFAPLGVFACAGAVFGWLRAPRWWP